MQGLVLNRRNMAEPDRSHSAHANLPLPTHTTRAPRTCPKQAWRTRAEPGHGFMKGGIMLYELSDAERRQMTLMEAAVTPDQEKKRALMRALDSVNDKYGRDTMRYAAQGPDDAFWRMRREKMSGHMTTQWDQLATVLIK